MTLEQWLRANEIIDRLEKPGAIPPALRQLRAIEALERIGSAEARQLVEMVAGGTTDSLVTREARVALARW